MSSPFCVYPSFHQDVSTNGSTYPCCLYWADAPADSHFSDFFKSQFMDNIRQKMTDHDLPKPCMRCHANDMLGTKSSRQVAQNLSDFLKIDLNSPPLLVSHGVNLSNVCNLACRTCNSSRSTRWIADELVLGEKPAGVLKSGWHLTPEQAAVVRNIEFLGGEPLLHQEEIKNCLQLIKEVGCIETLFISLTSNCTVPLQDELVELASQCEAFHVGCSVDGYEKLNDYIRWPSRWADVVKNLDAIADMASKNNKITFAVYITISLHNINSFMDVVTWLKDRYDLNLTKRVQLIFARNQDYFNATNLNDDIKSYIHSILQPYIESGTELARFAKAAAGYLHEPCALTQSEFKNRYVNKSIALDRLRGIAFEDVNPDMAHMINASMW